MLEEGYQKHLSVKEVATMCGVNRGTVGYWIRSKKLSGLRKGKSYAILVGELLLFLKSADRQIPSEIAHLKHSRHLFGSAQPCWEYWQGKGKDNCCEGCNVYKNRIELCFSVKNDTPEGHSKPCADCDYYFKVYGPRIQLVHQFDMPAFVYKDLYILEGNQALARLCGYEEKDLIGLGLERLIHSDSIEKVIYTEKKRAMDDSKVPTVYNYFIKNKELERIEISAVVISLCEPCRSFLVLWKKI